MAVKPRIVSPHVPGLLVEVEAVGFLSASPR